MPEPTIFSAGGVGVRISASGTSSSAATPITGKGDSLIITRCDASTSTDVVYVVVGDSTVQAPFPDTTAGFPILPGTQNDQLVLDVNAAYYNNLHIAANCESGGSGIISIHRVFR